MAISYDPKYIKPFLEHRAAGYTVQAAMARLGGTKRQAYSWRSHEEWEEAMEMGAASAQLYWEERLHSAKGSEAAPVIFALKNFGPEDWREKREVELAGKDGGPITMIGTTMTPQEAADAYAKLIAG